MNGCMGVGGNRGMACRNQIVFDVWLASDQNFSKGNETAKTELGSLRKGFPGRGESQRKFIRNRALYIIVGSSKWGTSTRFPLISVQLGRTAVTAVTARAVRWPLSMA